MKLKIVTNILLFCAISSVLWVVNTHNAEAIIPTIKGKVINEKTGAPVPNVWVKLTTSGLPNQKCSQLSTPGIRYERADDKGQFTFPPVYYYQPNTDRVNQPIDTNLDGKNDAVMIEDMSQPYCEEFDGGRVYTHDFGCLSVPFTLTAVKPYNFDGSFSTVNLVFNNFEQDATVESNNIIYTPNTSNATPTPRIATPTPRVGTPTPRPSSIATATPRPSTTPNPTATTGCTSADCSQKQIGELTAIGGGFSVKDPVEKDKTAWVRISVRGQQGGVHSVILREQVTGTYFKINPLVPNSTLYLKLRNGNTGTETDITQVLCQTGNCITNATSSSFDLNLSTIGPDDTINVLFAVTPIAKTTGTKVPVDAVDGAGNQISKIVYTPVSGGTPKIVPVNNVTVSIDETVYNYFQAMMGNVFSNSQDFVNSIKSLLPSGKFFASQNEPIVISRGGTSFGEGKVSPDTNNKNIKNYPAYHGSVSYASIEATYKNKIKTINNSNFGTINQDGYYKLSSGDFVINNSWNGNKIKNKHITIFVENDLYIENPIQIEADGNSAVVFVVKGRVGINPNVKKIEGIFIADKVIDTACAVNQGGFKADNSCLPMSASEPLELQGMFYSGANGQFRLERTGAPGELFKYRPDLLFASTNQLGKVNTIMERNTRIRLNAKVVVSLLIVLATSISACTKQPNTKVSSNYQPTTTPITTQTPSPTISATASPSATPKINVTKKPVASQAAITKSAAPKQAIRAEPSIVKASVKRSQLDQLPAFHLYHPGSHKVSITLQDGTGTLSAQFFPYNKYPVEVVDINDVAIVKIIMGPAWGRIPKTGLNKETIQIRDMDKTSADSSFQAPILVSVPVEITLLD